MEESVVAETSVMALVCFSCAGDEVGADGYRSRIVARPRRYERRGRSNLQSSQRREDLRKWFTEKASFGKDIRRGNYSIRLFLARSCILSD